MSGGNNFNEYRVLETTLFAIGGAEVAAKDNGVAFHGHGLAVLCIKLDSADAESGCAVRKENSAETIFLFVGVSGSTIVEGNGYVIEILTVGSLCKRKTFYLCFFNGEIEVFFATGAYVLVVLVVTESRSKLCATNGAGLVGSASCCCAFGVLTGCLENFCVNATAGGANLDALAILATGCCTVA